MKVIELIGTSSESREKAATAAFDEAPKTLKIERAFNLPNTTMVQHE